MTEKDLANACTGAVNSFSFNGKLFAEEMLRQHKTIQQSFVRECIVPYLRALSVTENYDERNLASVELAKAVMDVADKHSLPFI